MKQKLLLFLGCMLMVMGMRAEESVTLSFANADQRISQDTEQQTWKNGCITFINAKASSSTSVADYVNPVRLYQGSSISIKSESPMIMNKIVFLSNGTAKYKTALKESLEESGYEYTNSGNNYTVTLSPATASFEIEKLTAQARLVSLTVYYVEGDGAPATPILTPSCSFLETQEVTISCSSKDATVYYTTDDSEFTTGNWTKYENAFKVSETTTVKAIAIRGDNRSEIVSATYTKVSEDDYVNVSFSINGEVDVDKNVKILKEGELQESSLPEISFPNGISLKGWSKDKNSTDVETFPITNITDDITLYAVFVRPASFRLVTDVAELTAGDKVIIACPEKDRSISTATMEKFASYTVVDIIGKSLIPTAETRVFTLGNNDEYFTFENEGQFLACPSDANQLAMQEADGSEDSWTITINEEGVAVIKNKAYTKRSIQYNSSSPRFACYESVQKSIAIYKEATSEVLSTAYTPITISSIGYATMYLADAVAMPAGVEAYIATGVNGDYLQMEQVMGTLPAETGVILKAAEGEYAFIHSTEEAADVSDNLLEGTTVDTYVAGPAYVLANETKGVGLYKATLNKDEAGADGTTHFKNNANKAYLPASAVASNAPMFSFSRGGDEEDTTGIEYSSPLNSMPSTAIYDLTGRRVEKMEKGIYIVNGKKVIR